MKTIMINLKLLTKGLRGVLSPSEFITLFVIESALGKTNEYKKLYNEMIADLTGLSVSQVKRNVNSLVEKGFIIKKTLQRSRFKRECIYCLNLFTGDSNYTKNEFIFEQKNDNSEATGEPLNNIKQLKTTVNNCKQCKTTETNIKYDDLPF